MNSHLMILFKVLLFIQIGKTKKMIVPLICIKIDFFNKICNHWLINDSLEDIIRIEFMD